MTVALNTPVLATVRMTWITRTSESWFRHWYDLLKSCDSNDALSQLQELRPLCHAFSLSIKGDWGNSVSVTQFNERTVVQ